MGNPIWSIYNNMKDLCKLRKENECLKEILKKSFEAHIKKNDRILELKLAILALKGEVKDLKCHRAS